MRMSDGRVLTHCVPVARGHPRRPFHRCELLNKLAECGRHAAIPRSETQIAALEQGIMDLERLTCGAELAALLA
jgi:hypothetical protein